MNNKNFKKMEYNTERKNIVIPEYGRNIHKMIEYAITIEDRNERNKCAWGIIRVMGDLNPHLRDVPDFQHKLWDQLFIMSNFKLDVDSPFQKPEKLKIPPKKMKYPERLKEFRYYGKIIKDLIKIAINCLDEEKKEALTYAIANTMKKSHFKWNKDTVQDNIIVDDLKKLSGHKLLLNLYNNDPLVNVENILNYSKKRNKTHSFYIKKKRYLNNGHI